MKSSVSPLLTFHIILFGLIKKEIDMSGTGEKYSCAYNVGLNA
jgi:hypothetical protein